MNPRGNIILVNRKQSAMISLVYFMGYSVKGSWGLWWYRNIFSCYLLFDLWYVYSKYSNVGGHSGLALFHRFCITLTLMIDVTMDRFVWPFYLVACILWTSCEMFYQQVILGVSVLGWIACRRDICHSLMQLIFSETLLAILIIMFVFKMHLIFLVTFLTLVI